MPRFAYKVGSRHLGSFQLPEIRPVTRIRWHWSTFPQSQDLEQDEDKEMLIYAMVFLKFLRVKVFECMHAITPD